MRSAVDVYIASDPVFLGRGAAGVDGMVAVTVTLPLGMSGKHSIVLYDPASGIGMRQAIQVTSDALPATGGSNTDAVMIAMGLLLFGAAGVLVERRAAASSTRG